MMRQGPSIGCRAYERRAQTGETWLAVAEALPAYRVGHPAHVRERAAMQAARRHARYHGKPWPIVREATADRDAGEDERRAALADIEARLDTLAARFM